MCSIESFGLENVKPIGIFILVSTCCSEISIWIRVLTFYYTTDLCVACYDLNSYRFYILSQTYAYLLCSISCNLCTISHNDYFLIELSWPSN